MAENEELDLHYPNSARWRHLWQLIEHGSSEEQIAQQAVHCVYKTCQRLFDYLPFAELLSAAAAGGDTIQNVVRRCGRGRDYARLFELAAEKGADHVTIAERVTETILDRFLDQIALNVVGSPRWPDFQAFAAFRERLADSVRTDLHGFAEQLAANPHSAPRMKGTRRKGKASRHREMLGMSVSPKRGKSFRVSFG
jgi:hypothetical protein